MTLSPAGLMSALQFLPLGAVKPRGWLKQQMLDDLERGYAGRLDALTERAATDLFTGRIGTSQSQFAWWDSETRGNWLWGYVMMSYLAQHPAHIARVEVLIDKLLASQDADGYIGIYAPEWRYQHPPGENGELWSQGRALLALLACYEFTGKQSVLAAVERTVRLTMSKYGAHNRYFKQGNPPSAEMTGLTHGLCYVDVLAWLFRLTEDTAYRDFGVWLFDDFCSMITPFPNDDMVVSNLLNDHRPFSGHAVHTVEHLRTLLWAAAVAEREDLKLAAAKALQKLRRYMLPNSAVIGDEGIHGFPRPDIGYEYCTITELAFSLIHSLSLDFGAWPGDSIERLVFNAAQGARLPDGTGIAYLATDTRLSATSSQLDSYGFLLNMAGRFKYSPTHEDVACCCNPNSVRLLPHYVSSLWRRSEDGLAAATYGACSVAATIHGVNVHLDEDTDYPFSDEIVITVTPASPVEFVIRLRRPAWAQQVIVQVEGAQPRVDGDYIAICKLWQPGDVLRVQIDNTPQLTPYLTGDCGVFYGALQFVLPFDHQLSPIKEYPVAGFYDYDVLPTCVTQVHEPLLLDGTQEHYGLRLERHPEANTLRPWHTAPLRLAVGDKHLIPLGCTLLRRAAFPALLPRSDHPAEL